MSSPSDPAHPAELSCRPLDSYKSVLDFLKDPPVWRNLCKPLTPHSKKLIRNSEINNNKYASGFDKPETFCDFDPDAAEVDRHPEELLPQTLVCHDMANGYHDDSFIDGTEKYDAYTFYNWAGIDIFCYFSHHMVTIPPLGWINVGHAHGVKVIGTIITEWTTGAEFWDKMLDSEIEYQRFADALVTIAKTLKFEGWLLNIENKVAKPLALLEFVRFLHRRLHQEVPDALLLWYDSVTIAGALVWQNGLNEHNRAFFDACDGLFTNYSWSPELVAASAAAAAEGARLRDLFVGIDVWGRNFYGGGKFNTRQAVQVAHAHGCSLAVFAPAWAHEAADGERVALGGALQPYARFLLRDRALWGSLWRFLHTRAPSHLPFATSFCRGQGTRARLCGKVCNESPWYNLRLMQYQPNSAHGPHGYALAPQERIEAFLKNDIVEVDGDSDCSPAFVRRRLMRRSPEEDVDDIDLRKLDVADPVGPKKTDDVDDGSPNAPERAQPENREDKKKWTTVALLAVPGERECLELYAEDSFTGGSCLRLRAAPAARLTRLLHCDFGAAHGFLVCVAAKPLGAGLTLRLAARLAAGAVRVELLDPSAEEPRPAPGVLAVRPAAGQLPALKKHLLLHETDFYVPVENSCGWSVRYYDVALPGAQISSISCRVEGAGCVLLGHLGVCARPLQL